MMNWIIFGSTIAFLISFLIIPIIIKLAVAKHLLDVPTDRKMHIKPVPSLGGVAIFAGFILSLLCVVSIADHPEFQYYLIGFIVLFFVGVKDDVITLSAAKKFIAQVAISCVVIYKAHLNVNNLHGILGVYGIEYSVSFLLTLFAFVVIINSFNLIDGVDGLAGSVGLVSVLSFSVLLFQLNQPASALLGFVFCGALAGFLVFNFYPAKIFMGDTGSLLMGLVNAILATKLLTLSTTETASYPIQFLPVLALGILLLPLMDTLRVFTVRLFKGVSPFSPDRNHLHHLMLDRGWSQWQVTLCCVGLTMLFISVAFFSRGQNLTVAVILLVVLFFLLVYLIHRLPTKVQKKFHIEVKKIIHNSSYAEEKSASLKSKKTAL